MSLKVTGYLLLSLVFCCLFLNNGFTQAQAKPTVKVMINEQIWVDEEIIYDYYGNLADIVNIWTNTSQADTTIIESLLKNGYRVVGSAGPGANKVNVPKENILNATEGDDLSSINIGNHLKADLIIVGKAVAKGSSPVAQSAQVSARANINARVIKIDTGEIIATASDSATAVAIDEISAGNEAIKKAAITLAESLIKKISQ
ncbi:MAG: hypothetical protein JW734_02415 [Candidatus Omnitrophica bacterium]|nr:hypothetical protein [Candidatus Omnitrophota bacterium]